MQHALVKYTIYNKTLVVRCLKKVRNRKQKTVVYFIKLDM